MPTLPNPPRWSASFVGTMAAELSDDAREQITSIVKGALVDLDRKLDPHTLERFFSNLDDALGLYQNALEAQQATSLSGTRAGLRQAAEAAYALAYRLRALDQDARMRIRLPRELDLFKVEDVINQLHQGLDTGVAEVEGYYDRDTPLDNATCHLLVLTARAMKTHFNLKPSAVIGGTLHSIAEAMLVDFHGTDIEGDGNIIGRRILLRALKTPVNVADDEVITIGAEVT